MTATTTTTTRYQQYTEAVRHLRQAAWEVDQAHACLLAAGIADNAYIRDKRQKFHSVAAISEYVALLAASVEGAECGECDHHPMREHGGPDGCSHERDGLCGCRWGQGAA